MCSVECPVNGFWMVVGWVETEVCGGAELSLVRILQGPDISRALNTWLRTVGISLLYTIWTIHHIF